MNLLHYQRTIFGYHGCDKSVAEAVLSGNRELNESDNHYDWLGSGIYFWEHGPNRALEWAENRALDPKSTVKTPAVVGAVIHLGVCFDLMDTHYTDMLESFYPAFVEDTQRTGRPMPENRQAKSQPHDWLLRELDCQFINWLIPQIEAMEGIIFHTLRCAFVEGPPAFPGAGIRKRSHIQVTVRRPEAIVGYFRPVD